MTTQREKDLFQAQLVNHAMEARNADLTHVVKQQASAQGFVPVPLGQLKNGLGSFEAALQVAEDALIAVADRQAKLDAVTVPAQAVSEAELVRRYPSLES
jgi:hypothetical protein